MTSKLSFNISVDELSIYDGFVTAANINGDEGNGSRSFGFKGPRRPKAPTNLAATFNITEKAIDCKWEMATLPGIKYALLYTTQVKPPLDDYHWSMISDIQESVYKLGGLQNFALVSGQKYTIKVKAISKFGLESYSSNIVVVQAIDPYPEKIPPPTVTVTGKNHVGCF